MVSNPQRPSLTHGACRRTIPPRQGQLRPNRVFRRSCQATECPVSESMRVIDAFFSEYLGYEVSAARPGQPVVVASQRRERRETTYATIFPLWVLVTRGRCVISTQPALLEGVSQFLKGRGAQGLQQPGASRELGQLVSRTLGRDDGYSIVSGPLFVCSPDSYRGHHLHPCRPVGVEDMIQLRVVGLGPGGLERSMSEGTCFAAFTRDTPVALSGTHAVGHMADQMGDLSVETLKTFRQQGYGKTVVSHVTEALLERGRVPLYATSDWNVASARTAHAVGYEPYGWQLRIQIQDGGSE